MTTRPPHFAALTPVQFDFDAQGMPFSPAYGDVYKSRAGALQEADEVFVAGGQLKHRWAHAASFTVLEMGFGLGVNVLATLAAWRDDPHRPRRLEIVSVEKHPLDADRMRRGHEALGVDTIDAARLRERLPVAAPGMHRIRLDPAGVTLTLCYGDALQIVPRLRLAVDAFFLDGFAPLRNPDMWSETLIKALARHARTGATLATYSAAGPVRQALAAAGFDASVLPGYGGKRHRLTARYQPRWRTFDPPAMDSAWTSRRALVIGAGLAGAASAAALVRAGWSVQVLEHERGPVCAGSAQPALADHLHVSPDDNTLARLSRAALLLSGTDGPLGDRGAPWRSPHDGARGKLTIAQGPAHRARQAEMVARLAFPDELLSAHDGDAASALAGVRIPHGGLWMPGCGSADPHRLAARWLGAAAGATTLRCAQHVALLAREGDEWAARDDHGALLASAPVVILANAGDAPRLAGVASMALRRIRGQSTLLDACTMPLAGLRAVLGGDAYACPLPGGETLVGSSFDDLPGLEPDPEADVSNLRRLSRMLGLDAAGLADHTRSGPCGQRYTTSDRMPMIGPLPDEAAARAGAQELARNDRLAIPQAPGLFGAFAFGSRGLLWSVLAAEVLVSMIEGSVLPVEADLLKTIDPSRFMRQALRRRGARALG